MRGMKSPNDRGIIQKRNKSTGNLDWYARIVRKDGEGVRKEFVLKADSKSHARRLREELVALHNTRGQEAIEGSKLLFRELCDVYKEKRLYEAEYHGEGKSKRKVGGVRSLASSLTYLKALRRHFGAKLVKNISYADIEDFKKVRLLTPTKRGTRSIADTNRTLALMKSILKFAKENRWISESPFEHGKPLISMADENRRERVLTYQEETRLLAHCVGTRSHLRPLVITAIDTAMRKGELLKLKWNDVDFDTKSISILALNTKTAKGRLVAMTRRVESELKNLWELSDKQDETLVFGIKDNFKRSFDSARRNASISDFRFHDLRHTAITRMVNLRVPPLEIMKISGHTQMTTFLRYLNPETDSIREIAEKLSILHEEKESLVMSDAVN